MTPKSTTYVQKVKVPKKNVEEVYKVVVLWLVDNRCGIIRKSPPNYIEARYGANFPLLQMGPRDENPKVITVKVSAFGGEVLLGFTFEQRVERMGNSGFVFWGLKLKELYEELGVDVTDTIRSELIPETWVKRIINNRAVLLAVLLICTVFFIGYSWERTMDFSVTLYFMIMLPILVLTFWDLQEHRKLLRKNRLIDTSKRGAKKRMIR